MEHLIPRSESAKALADALIRREIPFSLLPKLKEMEDRIQQQGISTERLRSDLDECGSRIAELENLLSVERGNHSQTREMLSRERARSERLKRRIAAYSYISEEKHDGHVTVRVQKTPTYTWSLCYLHPNLENANVRKERVKPYPEANTNQITD